MPLAEENVPLEDDGASGNETEKPTFSLLSGAAIFEPLPPRNYIVDSLLARGSITVLGGAGASAKTWITLSLTLAVSRGESWLNRFGTTSVVPLFIDYESGEFETRRRLQALNGGTAAKGSPNIAVCIHPPYALNSPQFAEALERTLPDHPLIVIDSLRAAIPGVDENDSTIRRHIDALRRIRGFQNASILIIAHARKGSAGDVREQLRGSGAIFDAADEVFMVKPEGEGEFCVQQTKHRFGPSISPFGFELVDEPGGTVRLKGRNPIGEQQSVEEQAILKAVTRAVMHQPGITMRELRERVKRRGTRVDAAVNELINSKTIRRTRTGFFVNTDTGGGHA